MAPLIGTFRRHFRQARSWSVIHVALTILSLHWALVLYINSTYLEQFVSSESVGVLYIVGSAITIGAFLYISRALERVGNYRLTLLLAGAETAALVGLAFAPSAIIAIVLFIVHQAVVPLILFNLDIFMEEQIGIDESATGSKRGLLLSIGSLAGAIAPLSAGALLGSGEPRFAYLYLTGAAIMVPFWYVITRHTRAFRDPHYDEVRVFPAIRAFWTNRDIRFVYISHQLLQLFFAWMVIYVPLYLATVIGLPWSEIGVVLFVGLMAYVFLEYPIGLIADRWLGEKEMMIAGFIIMGVSVVYIGLLSSAALIPWMVTMFLTRTGASVVETTTESYFFKHTRGDDASDISLFRVTRPLSYIIGAFLGSASLLFLSFSGIFLVLGALMFLGIISASMLEDTR